VLPNTRPAVATAQDPAPRGRVVHRNDKHAVGVFDDIVVLYMLRDASSDPSHVPIAAEALRAQAERTRRPARALAVLAGTAGPPSAAVRAAWQRASRTYTATVGKMAIVIQGDGFEAAMRRAAVNGLLLVIRPSVRPAIVRELREGLVHLIEPHESVEAVAHFCEHELLAKT